MVFGQAPVVDPDVKVNDSRGRDGTDTSDICCWDPDPTAPACVGLEWDTCCFNREKACLGGTNHTGDCTDDSNCLGGVCIPCDDEPKRQREMAIAVAPWDPNILAAAWMDGSKEFDGSGMEIMMGVAVSDDAGLTWKRFDPEFDPCNVSCQLGSDCFVIGSSFVRDDFCLLDWQNQQGDPAAAASEGDPQDPNRKRYLYLAGIDFPGRAFFSRLEWNNDMSGWESAIVENIGDKPYVTADPSGADVYVYHQGVRLSASRTAGDDFITPPPLVDSITISFSTGSGGSNGAGPVGAVGAAKEFNIVWAHFGGGTPVPGNLQQSDQIRYRRGTWNESASPQELDWVPPLPVPPLPDPPLPECTEGVDCGEPIIFGHIGFDAGLGSPGTESLLAASVHIGGIKAFPSIAVDRHDVDDLCGRGGTIYVAYVAEEWPGDCTDCADPDACSGDVLSRTVDSNIYVVRGRVRTVGPDTVVDWSAPVNVTPDAGPAVPCSDPDPGAPVACGMHLPFQFYPWIAVDDEGRVGVAYYDTTVDGDRCDANVIYQIKFSYSVDGGVTWEPPVVVSEVDSETSPDDPAILDPIESVSLLEYYGLTATSDEAGIGDGFFHPIWSDLRGWEGRALLQPALTFGDVYTARVTLTAANDRVISMGDYNRDGTNDQLDLNVLIGTCMCSTDVACEILDFDRDGLITTADEYHFHQCPHGVVNDPPPTCAGDPASCRSCTTCPDTPACADLDSNGIRDDVCTWWDCCATCCDTSTAPNPADMGGSYGACPPDGFCNIHDRNHALTCFAGTNGCETINIDAGGMFGACPPDGLCNIHDANHAGNCFAGKNPCMCGQSAMASGPPEVVGATALNVVRAPQLAASDTAVLRVFTQSALADLQSYQLELAVSGGTAGQFELVDISIEPRSDYVFAGLAGNFSAFNVMTGQMLSGVDIDAGVATSAHGYLATYTYAVSPGAAGDFVVDLRHDESAGDQTFLIASDVKKIEVAGSTPAVVATTP